MGSLSWAEQHYAMPMQAYKISKAALNMLHKITSLDLADEGFTLLAISPGVSFQRLLEHPPPPPLCFQSSRYAFEANTASLTSKST